ncbi:MAG: FkbM family methyltransferase [Paenibacillaceae bacterium]|nr:FkbM family methyltransferase [Paenibacillaceae bacterium]
MTGKNEFEEKLLNKDLYKTNAASYGEKISHKDNIILWGSGSASDALYQFFIEFHCLRGLKNYADNKKELWGMQKNGYTILSPLEVAEKAKEEPVYIIIASMRFPEIRKQLISLGIEDSMIDTAGFTVANDYYTYKDETAYQIVKSHFNEFRQVYNSLADKRSKEVYLNILNSKISLDNKYLEFISSPSEEQYFDQELLKLKTDEIFCDCGSYNGDTMEAFFQLTGGKCRKYIAIEADKEIYLELNQKVADRSYKNVTAHNIACWNKKTVLKFQSAKSAGHIADEGEIEVLADTLDHILKDEPVTMIKMDIEGAEPAALAGARTVISKYKPVLCICIYHNLKDYYTIPLMMKELNPDYYLFVRNYTDMVAVETVCYAVPKDRINLKLEEGVE